MQIKQVLSSMIVCIYHAFHASSILTMTKFQHLRKFKKGNFGRFNVNAEKFHIRHSKKEYKSNDLHKWCVVKDEELEREKLTEEMKNNKAAKTQLGMFCLL